MKAGLGDLGADRLGGDQSVDSGEAPRALEGSGLGGTWWWVTVDSGEGGSRAGPSLPGTPLSPSAELCNSRCRVGRVS